MMLIKRFSVFFIFLNFLSSCASFSKIENLKIKKDHCEYKQVIFNLDKVNTLEDSYKNQKKLILVIKEIDLEAKRSNNCWRETLKTILN